MGWFCCATAGRDGRTEEGDEVGARRGGEGGASGSGDELGGGGGGWNG